MINIDIRTEIRGLIGIKEEFDKEVIIELDKKQAEFDRQMDQERKKLADMVSTEEKGKNRKKGKKEKMEKGERKRGAERTK